MLSKKINILLVFRYISIVLVAEGLFIGAVALFSFLNSESVSYLMAVSAAGTLLTGLTGRYLTRWQKHQEPGKRDVTLIVSLGWIFLGTFGAVPFLLTGSIPHFADAFFESISGFTTTGASIIRDIEILPSGILLWRSLTHWIGGIGIIVLVIAVLPSTGTSSMSLFSSEASVVVEERMHARVRYVARTFGFIYVSLTVMEVISLCIAGMPLFDSVCHSFGTIATGGFGTKNTSIAAYSPAIHYIIAIFMMLAGMNFTLHFFAAKREFRKIWKNEEWQAYIFIILGVSLILTLVLILKMNYPLEKAFRNSFFQVSSIITATGFVTDNYLLWPIYGKMFIFLLMLIGASAGSTGGGVKVIRHVIAFKKIRSMFFELFHPKAVHPIRYNGKVIENSMVSSVIVFIIFYYAITAAGMGILMLMGIDRASSLGGVITCMGGIGPGFGTVGPVDNFAHLPDGAKYLLSLHMVIGRLEIYPVIILLTRWFWKD